MSGLATVNMLWIGKELGRIEHLSAVSFLAAGHPVHLHAYEDVGNVPQGVQMRDARETMSVEVMRSLQHQPSSSFALASDYFRFQLQKRKRGLWADLDMICLAPVPVGEPVLFGWESKRHLNGALLYLSHDSPVLTEAIDAFAASTVPVWVKPSKRIKLRIRSLFGLKISPATLPWGTFGPRALTYLARKHGVISKALDIDVLYPLPLRSAQCIYEPGVSLDTFVTERTLTVHLWNEALRDLRHTKPPKGSPLDDLCRRFGV